MIGPSYSNWMTMTGAAFLTSPSVIVPPNGQLTRILKANPRRFRVVFWDMAFGANMLSVFPGPVPDTLVGGGNIVPPLVSEFQKEPSVTSGEWYSVGDGVRGLYIIECLYTAE